MIDVAFGLHLRTCLDAHRHAPSEDREVENLPLDVLVNPAKMTEEE